VELTLDGDMQALGYQMSVGSVYNHVEVTCYPRSVGDTLEVLGRISQDDAIPIEAGAALAVVVPFRDSSNTEINIGGMSCVEPVAGADFLVTSDPGGEGDNENASITPTATFYGDRAEVTLTSAAGEALYLQWLQVRGYAVRARERVTVIAEDATSIAAYQRRKLKINAVLMSNPAEAQVLADFLLARYKDPQGVISGVGFVANVNATLMAAARDLELCDRVTVSETQTGLSSYAGHVGALDHRITPIVHRVTVSLMPHYDIGTPFRLDISQLDSGHYLIY
jgi:hypothetical protein